MPTELGPGESVDIYPVAGEDKAELVIASEPPASEDVVAVSNARFTLVSIDDVRIGLVETAAEAASVTAHIGQIARTLTLRQ